MHLHQLLHPAASLSPTFLAHHLSLSLSFSRSLSLSSNFRALHFLYLPLFRLSILHTPFLSLSLYVFIYHLDLQDIVRPRHFLPARNCFCVPRKKRKLEASCGELLRRESGTHCDRHRPSCHQRLARDCILPYGGEIEEGNDDPGGTVHARDLDSAASASCGAVFCTRGYL